MPAWREDGVSLTASIIAWRRQWIRAFPTLVSIFLSCHHSDDDDNDNYINNNDDFDTETTTSDSSIFTADWEILLAWDTLWSNYHQHHRHHDSMERKEEEELTMLLLNTSSTAPKTISSCAKSPSSSPSSSSRTSSKDDGEMDNRQNNTQSPDHSSVSVHQQHHHQWNASLGYGEIADVSIFKIFQRIRHYQRRTSGTVFLKNQDHDCQSTSTTTTTIVDLGSGTGRVLLAATMAASVASESTCFPLVDQPCSTPTPTIRPRIRAMGIEIIESLHQEARARGWHWHEWDMSVSSSSSSSSCSSACLGPALKDYGSSVTNLNMRPLLPRISLEWSCADFTTTTKIDWVAVADIVICHATVFEDALMDKINVLCRACRPGTWFVTVTRPLGPTTIACTGNNHYHHHALPVPVFLKAVQQFPASAACCTAESRHQQDVQHQQLPVSFFETVQQLQLSMSWGQATVYLQRRTTMKTSS